MKKEIFGLTPEELQQEFVAAGLKNSVLRRFTSGFIKNVFLNLMRCTISPRQILPF